MSLTAEAKAAAWQKAFPQSSSPQRVIHPKFAEKTAVRDHRESPATRSPAARAAYLNQSRKRRSDCLHASVRIHQIWILHFGEEWKVQTCQHTRVRAIREVLPLIVVLRYQHAGGACLNPKPPKPSELYAASIVAVAVGARESLLRSLGTPLVHQKTSH